MVESLGSSYNDALVALYEGYEDEDDDFSQDEDDLARIIPPAVEDTKEFLKARHILGLMGFLGFASTYAMRVNLSVIIVAMVNSSAIPHPNDSVITDVCPNPNVNTTIPDRDGEFVWDETTQALVLGAFFYGYIVTQVPGGRFAELYGGRKVYGWGVLLTAIFTLVSPFAAQFSFPLFILIRVLEGLAEGVTYPAMHAMLAKWIPPIERSRFGAYVYAGSNLGTIISMPLSGYLCDFDFLGGWPLSFYLFGALGILWFFFWMYLVYDSPATHPRIDPQERIFIEASIGPETTDAKEGIPWRKMLTCVPLWAILVTQCCQSWAFYTQLTELPTYMKNILHFNLEANAVLSAIPAVTSWFGGIFFSLWADWMLLKGWISPATSYKFFNSIASIIPSLGLIGVAWAGCDRMLVQYLLDITATFGGAVFAGNQMNHLSLNPKYAGTMFGITNAAANMMGFLAPLATGAIINGNETLGQWRLIFYISVGINLAGNLFYVVFGSAKLQDWSDNPSEDQTGHLSEDQSDDQSGDSANKGLIQ